MFILSVILSQLFRHAPDTNGGGGGGEGNNSQTTGQGAGNDTQAGQGAGTTTQTGQGAGTTTQTGQGAGTTTQADQGAGTTTQTGQGADTTTQTGQGAGDGDGDPDEWRAGYERMIERYDRDLGRVATDLYRDNYQQREEIRSLRAQIDQDRADVEAYRSTGRSPAEIRGLIRRQEIGRVAQAAGYNADVLETLDRAAGNLTYEIREEQIDGQPARVAYVQPDDGEAQPLAEFVARQWAQFMPALQPQQAAGQGAGVSYPAQGAGNQNGRSSYVDRYIEAQRQASQRVKNPLLDD